MKRSWCAGIVIIAMAAALAPIALVLRGGISTRVEPSPLEATVARRLRSLAIPEAARSATNPFRATPKVLAEGLAHFADHCASCHGNDGSGSTPVGRSLYPRAPDMRAPATRNLSDGELFYIIENGTKFTGMPGWGGAGRPQESWKLVLFIRHLPDLSAEEQAEMRRLNPRGPEEWRELEDEEEFLRGGDPAARPSGRHAH